MRPTIDHAAEILVADPAFTPVVGSVVASDIDDAVHDAVVGQARLVQPISAIHRGEVSIAIAALIASVTLFAFVAPFAKTQLGQLPAFVPMYVSALILCDLITAALLFSQFSVIRSRALLVLAAGYLFTAGITVFYALIFPGTFAPTGLLGAGPQTTSAMYMFWHAGFPVIVIAYALLKGSDDTIIRKRRTARLAITSTIAVTLAVVVLYTVFATSGHALLPPFLVDNHTTMLGRSVLGGIWMLSLVALIVLWRRRPHTVLDFWLMLVMGVWLFDIGLSALLNAGRYDVGWYVGRVYGLLAASALLVVLLVENGKVYARLAGLTNKLNDANKALEQLSLHDPLTGLANRRHFDGYLAAQIAIGARHRRPLALILCDIDLFKNFNDHYGHQMGDECLKQVAGALRACCRRPADLAARYGGEEFALILPDTDPAGAELIAEMVRAAIVALAIPHAGSSVSSWVSISSGIASQSRAFSATAAELIAEADVNLFTAKRLGRNRVASAHVAIDAFPRPELLATG